MSEAEMPRVDGESSSSWDLQLDQSQALSGYDGVAGAELGKNRVWSLLEHSVYSEFSRVQADAAESGKNRVWSLLLHSVYNDYGRGNPRIASDIASRTRIIREIATKNDTNADGEILWLEELIRWTGESQDQKEKTIRAYSLYLYLEKEIARIPDELKESKRDYIIFLQEKIVELSGVIGSCKNIKPTLLTKMFPTVKKYALAVTSVVALWSLWYAKYLKSENDDIGFRIDYVEEFNRTQCRINSSLKEEVERLEKEKISIEKEKNSIIIDRNRRDTEARQEQERLSTQLTDKSKEYLSSLADDSQRFVALSTENTRILQENHQLEDVIKKLKIDIISLSSEKKMLLWEAARFAEYRDKFVHERNSMSSYIFTAQKIGAGWYNEYFDSSQDAFDFIINPDSNNVRFRSEIIKKYGSYENVREKLRLFLKE